MKNRRNIILWASQKGLLDNPNPQKQLAKTLEELGETTGAFVKQNGLKVVDGVGDIFITLIIIAKQLDIEKSIDNGMVLSPPKACDELTYLFNISREIGTISDRINSNQFVYCDFPIVECVRNLRGFCDLIGHDLEYCLDHAYNEIKNRTGKLKDGVFVKD